VSPQASWILQEEVVPRLRSAIPRNVSPINAEDAEELVQDATCMAAKLLDNAEKANKHVTPGNIAYYTILHMKSGRRSYGASTVDALGIGAQLNGRSRTTSFDEPVQIDELGEEFTVNDVFSTDEEDPGQKAARKMDWEAFLTGLTAREKALVEGLLAGRTGSEIARMFGLDRSTIQYFKNRLADKILAFMGHDILLEIRRWPGWKNSLNANRERLACKNQRRN
jgi:DNA-directed RNA polymerase specialized sigma24 family protein